MKISTYFKVYGVYFVYLGMCLGLGVILLFLFGVILLPFFSEAVGLKILSLCIRVIASFSFVAPIIVMGKLIIWARARSRIHEISIDSIITEAIFFGHDFFENDDEYMVEYFNEILEFSFLYRWLFMFEFRMRNVFFISMIITLAWLIIGEIK